MILEPVLKELEVGCCDTFIGNLEEKAQKSRTCRLWLDSLIKPVLLSHFVTVKEVLFVTMNKQELLRK